MGNQFLEVAIETALEAGGIPTMLLGLHPLLSPDLLHALASAGHGDHIAIVDANFPAASIAQRLIPLHDALLLGLWIWAFGRSEVSWRQERFGVGRDGSLHRVPSLKSQHRGETAE